MTTVIFHDFPDLENFFLKFHDLPVCVGTLLPSLGVLVSQKPMLIKFFLLVLSVALITICILYYLFQFHVCLKLFTFFSLTILIAFLEVNGRTIHCRLLSAKFLLYNYNK